MAILVQCPECETKLKVKDESAGKKARCPRCQTVIPVPLEEEPEVVEERVVDRPRPSPKKSRDEDEEDEDEEEPRRKKKASRDDDDDDDDDRPRKKIRSRDDDDDEEDEEDSRRGRQRKKMTGKEANTWGMMIHLSQLASIIIPAAGFILPIVLWLVKRNESRKVDAHGKVVLNWIISSFIYGVIIVALFVVSAIVAAGSAVSSKSASAPIGIIIVIVIAWCLLALFGLMSLIFIIIGAVKANNGEVWPYPMSIRFMDPRI